MLSRDPRFSNETLAYLYLAAQTMTPQSKGIDLETMRREFEELGEKGNVRFNGIFKGNIEEQVVKTNSAGRFFCFKNTLV